jgi:rhodanese-related sulfurtransferase
MLRAAAGRCTAPPRPVNKNRNPLPGIRVTGSASFSIEYLSGSHSTSVGDFSMAFRHPPRFLKIVEDAKTRVRETTVDEIKARLDRGDNFVLIDVREESEFQKDHLPGAIHMGKGVIERDIEHEIPDLNAPLVLYCGGGFRSALAADNLQKMGYTNVISMDGGVRGWREKGYPFTKD